MQANPLRELPLDELRRRTSMKWRTHPADVLPLWVAEMDVPLAEPIVRAVNDAMALGDTGYPAGREYAEALADFARHRWNWDGVDVARTALVPDVMSGIVEMIKLVSAPGSPVIINCPVYPPFYAYVRNIGRPVVEAPLDTGGRLDCAALASAFRRAADSPGTPTFLLCSPHNPTGALHTAAELADVARIAEEHGVRVVVDEIHAPIVAAGASFTPYLSVPGGERGLSLLSASKAWNLAGLKSALAVAGDAAADDLARLPEEVSKGGPSHVGAIAHTAALRDGGDWLDALLAGLDENRRLLADLLAEHLPTLVYRPAESTFLAWLDCRTLGLPDPAELFLERGRVALNPGPTFGPGGEGHARLNIGTSPEIITEAVRRMAAALG